MTAVLNWLNGRKTAIGLVITFLASLLDTLPPVVEALGGNSVTTAQVLGMLLTVVGAVHKIVKGR